MLKRRTIAMLVAGTLIGAQAGIAANDQEGMTSETSVLVPVEQAIVLEPTVLSESDVSRPTSDLVAVETAPINTAAAEQPSTASTEARDAEALRAAHVERDRTYGPSLTTQRFEMPFKGHPVNASEIAGLTTEQALASSQHAQSASWNQTASSRDYRGAGNFPMNVSETAGSSPQALEAQRMAQLSSGSNYQVASAPTSGDAKIE